MHIERLVHSKQCAAEYKGLPPNDPAELQHAWGKSVLISY
jgi:hypothetical protein